MAFAPSVRKCGYAIPLDGWKPASVSATVPICAASVPSMKSLTELSAFGSRMAHSRVITSYSIHYTKLYDAAFGKFLAAFSFSALLLAPTLFYAVTAAFLGDLDPGPVIGGYLGALFLAARNNFV